MLWFFEFFPGYRAVFIPKRGSWFVRCGDAVMTSQNEIEDKNALRVVWFVIIALTAVLAAAIAAVVTSALGAVALVVLSSAVGTFLAIFGLGVKVHDFFRTP
jgi:hypothetical protein